MEAPPRHGQRSDMEVNKLFESFKGKSGGKGGTGEGHGQLASPTRATRGAQLEWQWGNQGGTAGVSRIAAAARGC